MNDICWGMVGCGTVTEKKNGPGLYKAENSKLIGVTNRTISKAQDWVNRHGVGKVYPTVKELLSEESIDIIYIATTPDSHKELAIMCAEYGKHCYLEKPIALSYQDGIDIKKAFDKAGKKIWIAHYRRAMKRYLFIKKLLDQDTIGNILAVDIVRIQKPLDSLNSINKWQLDSRVSGGGAFFEGDIHMLDLTDFLIGPSKDIKIIAKGNKDISQEEVVSLSLETESGVIVNGMWCYNSISDVDCYRIVGDSGMITFAYGDNSGPISIITNKGSEIVSIEEEMEVGTGLIQTIVNELNGDGICDSPIEVALRSLKIAEDVILECKIVK